MSLKHSDEPDMNLRGKGKQLEALFKTLSQGISPNSHKSPTKHNATIAHLPRREPRCPQSTQASLGSSQGQSVSKSLPIQQNLLHLLYGKNGHSLSLLYRVKQGRKDRQTEMRLA